MPKHTSYAADLAAEVARIIDGESVRPAAEGHISVVGIAGDTVTAQVLDAHDRSVIVGFTIDVTVPE